MFAPVFSTTSNRSVNNNCSKIRHRVIVARIPFPLSLVSIVRALEPTELSESFDVAFEDCGILEMSYSVPIRLNVLRMT